MVRQGTAIEVICCFSCLHLILASLLSADFLIHETTLVAVVGMNVDKVQSCLAVPPFPDAMTKKNSKKVKWAAQFKAVATL